MQTASVSKTTYFYQVGSKHRLCGASVFIDAVLCAGPGYLTTAVHLRLSGLSVWASAQSGLARGAPAGLKWPIKLAPCFYWEHSAFAFLDRYGFYKRTPGPNAHSHMHTDAQSRDGVLDGAPAFCVQCAETKPSCRQGSYLRVGVAGLMLHCGLAAVLNASTRLPATIWHVFLLNVSKEG